MVEHLLMRGERPEAIRILDLTPPTRRNVVDSSVEYIRTDVTKQAAVQEAFQKQWVSDVETLPLTVFHCAAFIRPSDRKADFLPPYIKNNIQGTKVVLQAARAANTSCFIVTSSASIAIREISYFPWPWQRWPRNLFQVLPNAEPENLRAPLENFRSCYAWSKAQVEIAVRDANDPQSGFLTGAIRPGHAIYGHGIEATTSLTYDYLRRGGSPSWLHGAVANFVDAQNVSIGHLAYEDALLNNKNAGGKAYCVTDPNPPITYGHLYQTLTTLAHPSTPIKFPKIPSVLMLLLSYLVEAYDLFRIRYVPRLPQLSSDISMVQPAMFQMCTLHIAYDDSAARKEIGYRAPVTTLEGFAASVLDWNNSVEGSANAKVTRGGEGGLAVP